MRGRTNHAAFLDEEDNAHDRQGDQAAYLECSGERASCQCVNVIIPHITS